MDWWVASPDYYRGHRHIYKYMYLINNLGDGKNRNIPDNKYEKANSCENTEKDIVLKMNCIILFDKSIVQFLHSQEVQCMHAGQ